MDWLPVTVERNAFKLNVGFLVNQQIGTFRDFHFDHPHITIEDLELFNLGGVARFSRTPQGLLAQGDFYASTPAECVRCLGEFSQPLHSIFEELYAFTEKGMTDSGLMVPEGSVINLGPLLREYLLLEIPIRPICREDCKGLCPECGADLNQALCEHQQVTTD